MSSLGDGSSGTVDNGFEGPHFFVAGEEAVVDHQYSVLVRAIGQLTSARRLEDISEIVRTAARRIANADGATFVVRDGDFCHYVDEDAMEPLWKGQKFPARDCISGWVMNSRRRTSITDIYVDPRIPHDLYRPTFVKSLLMVPVGTRDTKGAIGVYWAMPHEAVITEIILLETLAMATWTAMSGLDSAGAA